jgi:hypothetical protein
MTITKQQIKDGQQKWGQGVDPTDTDSVIEYIDYKVLEYEYYDFIDNDLWDQFKEDFVGFTEDTLKPCGVQCLRRLRTSLRDRGIWVLSNKNITIAKSLSNTIEEEEQTQWTQEELLLQKTLNPKVSYLLYHEKKITPEKYTTPRENTPEPNTTPRVTTPELYQTTEHIKVKEYSKELGSLVKYYSEESKYSSENDNFDFKLTIFYDLCTKAAIPKVALAQAYSTMLKGMALDHYYTNLKNSGTTSFEQMHQATRNYFEGPEYRRKVLGQWNAATLRAVINKNPTKSKLDCLQLLIKDLRHLQHGLDFEMHIDKFLHNKLILACQDLEARKYACYKPAESVAGLINDL